MQSFPCEPTGDSLEAGNTIVPSNLQCGSQHSLCRKGKPHSFDFQPVCNHAICMFKVLRASLLLRKGHVEQLYVCHHYCVVFYSLADSDNEIFYCMRLLSVMSAC